MDQKKLKMDFLVSPEVTIRETMTKIDRNEKGIALVVDPKNRLLGTVTDGDIRRAVLAGASLEAPVKTLFRKKRKSPFSRPITEKVGAPVGNLLEKMMKLKIRQIPILNLKGAVVDLVILDDIRPSFELPLQAVVMAGGYGKRLYPFTKKTPKPMLPVGNDPILKLLISQLRDAGITKVDISTHYKSEQITKHFGDGKDLGVELRYITEDRPLGTAGALGLIKDLDKTLLVINGDILTKINFQAMLDFHKKHKADMTVAVQSYDMQINYGIVETNGVYVQHLTEKPKFSYLVNAGIYLLEPSVQKLIPKGDHLDMTDLIQKLLDTGRPVASFPVREYWLDVGNPQDYKRAQGDVKKGKYKL